jgi:hypothetical protein
MASTEHNPILIGNMTNQTSNIEYIGLYDINCLIGALLNDVSILLTNDLLSPVKTASRRAEDESFNLQDFENTDDYELLLTYYPSESLDKLNECNNNILKFDFDVFYRIRACPENKPKLEEIMGLVEKLLCFNSNNQNRWSLNNKSFSTSLYISNKLILQDTQYDSIIAKNMYFAKQTYKFIFRVTQTI